jgi:YidC/Oxa1 family membrane protein insertase
MSFLFSLYIEALYRPILNSLVWLYVSLPWNDVGLAIVLLTVAIRIILTPILWKGQNAQKKLSSLQPEMKRIQEQHKNDREGQGKAMMELYAQNKVNPFSGCLLLLVQLPVLIALFQVFQKGFNASELQYLYSFVSNPGVLNPVSFGFLDLSKGNLIIGVVAAITQYFQTKLMMPQTPPSGKNDFASIMQRQSLYIFPALILVWSYTLPSALALYWTTLNTFGIVQELVARKLARPATPQ